MSRSETNSSGSSTATGSATTNNYQRTSTSGGSATEVPWYEFHEFQELALEERLYNKMAQLKRQPTQHAALLIPDWQVVSALI